MPAPSPFVRQVRHALAHLYDPDILRTHALLGPLALGNRANPQTALRETLLAAIESLRPAPTVPVDSRAWRVYRVLQCRYVQQLPQEQTAHQLGVGVRHVRREQRVAVQALADALHQKCGLLEAEPGPNHADMAARFEGEATWLKSGGEGEPASLPEALSAALRLVAPLGAAREVQLETPPSPDLPPVAIHPAALRQAVVSVASCAIRRAPGGRVRFSAGCEGRQAWLRVVASGRGALVPGSDEEAASLEAARALLSLDGGRLETAERVGVVALTLAVPVAGAVDVLLVDDNADFAQLFGRYVAGTRYRLHCLSDTDRLFPWLSERRPQVIVLDVMMPGVDGWEVLGRLRQHPLTADLPIVVCTIVPERELALTLGATAYLPKPVTRQALLGALYRALGEEPPESR
jgi:CheY-like chemotaxis protein